VAGRTVIAQGSGSIERVSVASDGSQANGESALPAISADGRYVTFQSSAGNLVSGDTNGYWDVFVHDRQTGQTSRVSVASDGSQGNGVLQCPMISADGRYVAFNGWADNLVPGDTNYLCDTDVDGIWDDNCPDVFVHDRQTGHTQRVSVASDGSQGNGGVSQYLAISADGRYVVFASSSSNLEPEFSDTNETWDIFVHDQQTGQTRRVSMASDGSQGDKISEYPAISADGRCVAFGSYATNLVPGDTNSYIDVFVWAGPVTYLPLVLKEPMTNLFITNRTGGLVYYYKVRNTPQGDKECTNIPDGRTVPCGSFTPGRYWVEVDFQRCGKGANWRDFPPGDFFREVRCP
jgi:archaellum component FlaF (FlaF/FlaG flagellin family)